MCGFTNNSCYVLVLSYSQVVVEMYCALYWQAKYFPVLVQC